MDFASVGGIVDVREAEAGLLALRQGQGVPHPGLGVSGEGGVGLDQRGGRRRFTPQAHPTDDPEVIADQAGVRKQEAAKEEPNRDHHRPAVAGFLRLQGHDAEGWRGGSTAQIAGYDAGATRCRAKTRSARAEARGRFWSCVEP